MNVPILDALRGHDPNALAIEVFGGETRTYGELQVDVRRVATSLAALGVESGTRVVCDAGRTLDHVAIMLGCWWIGAVFVPLERALPAARRTVLLASVEPALPFPNDWRDSDPTEHDSVPFDAEAPAYIAFTSGSSGTPKAALLPHAGLPALAFNQSLLFGAEPGRRTSWGLAAHFDASFSDILVPLHAGATLVVIPEDGPSLLDAIGQAQLDCVDLPPSMLKALLNRGIPDSVTTLIVGGEAPPRDAMHHAAEHTSVLNVYGPTEATVCASFEIIDRSRPKQSSIGFPLPGNRFEVETSGELIIGGPSVALCYIGDPGSDKFFTRDGTRYFRTGDRVRCEEDGSYTYLGRLDRQVQIRGKRIEPEEIERTLVRHPEIDAAAVIAVEGEEPRLEAIFEGRASEEATRTWLSDQIEPWKLPTRIEHRDSIPRLASGKVDFVALGTARKTTVSARRNPHAEPGPLIDAWTATFGDTDKGNDENFFDRGGDSISALELSIEAARRGLRIEPETITSYPRLGDMLRASTIGIDVANLNRRVDQTLGVWPKPTSRSIQGDILLTGGTGFLGPWLIEALVNRGARVTALVRGSNDGHARERLERAFGEGLPAEVSVLAGDVSSSQLGLEDGVFARTVRSTRLVLHAASAIDLSRGYAALAPVNVIGTKHMLEFARAAGARFDLVSTLSVFAESDCSLQVVPDALDLAAAERLHGGYAQTKWVADAMCSRTDLWGTTTRLGLLVGPPRSGRPGCDQLARTMRGLETLGMWPAHCDERSFDVTPVREAADAIARASLSTMKRRRVQHVARSAPATGALLRQGLRMAGATLETVESWPPPCAANESLDSDTAVARLAMASGTENAPRAGDLFLCTRMRFQSKNGLSDPPTAEELASYARSALGDRSSTSTAR